MEVVVENFVVVMTRGRSVVGALEAVIATLPVGLVVKGLRLIPLLAWVLMPCGMLRNTRAGGNWLIGGMIAIVFYLRNLLRSIKEGME